MRDVPTGVLNAPDPEFNPAIDEMVVYNYGPKNHRLKKLENKRHIQDMLNLETDDNAPLFFWPSRLDPVQKGCQLMADILFDMVSSYWDTNLQVVFVANGPFQKYFTEIVDYHRLHRRISVNDFTEALSHQAFAAADFLLMPSSFEPCGLPQMTGCIYGTLPIVFDTGGLHDTIRHMDAYNNTGNGFVFGVHDPGGFRWAVDEAMAFHRLDPDLKEQQISRIMTQSVLEFSHTACAAKYIEIYEKMLSRPFIV